MTAQTVDLKALISREISAAQSDDAEQAKKRADALRYYQGEMPDIVAELGRSSVVSNDVADTVGLALPGLMRVFAATDQTAIAEPVGAEDIEIAKQATDGINYVFWKDNPGYSILRSAIWDALVNGDGIVKTFWDDTPEYVVTVHSGKSSAEIIALFKDDSEALDPDAQRAIGDLPKLADGDEASPSEENGRRIEVLAFTRHEPFYPPGPDGFVWGATNDIKIRRLRSKGRTVVECIAREDYGKDGDAKSCKDARFQYHRRERTRSQLIEMGFERTIVEKLGVQSQTGTDEQAARAVQGSVESAADRSMEIIDLYECFVQVDVDDDGVAETVRCYYAGNPGGGDLLKIDGWDEPWEVWEDETPFYSIPCDPMPHRFDSRSLADKATPTARVKTVLQRGYNDNLYANNSPQRFVKGKIINPEELFSPSFGGVVFGDVNSSVETLAVNFVANHVLDALAYQDTVLDRRTGIARQSMGLDPDALQNQTATANQNARDASYSQIELIARDMAELGWREVFRAILRLEIKHQDRARMIRLRGKFVEVDPRSWNTDMDITINVGLGTGSRDRDLMMLRSVQADQVMLIQGLKDSGFEEKALEMLEYLRNTLAKKAESAGIKTPEMFFPEVDPSEIAAGKKMIAERKSKPDPKIAMEQERAKADQQIAMGKAQADTQLQQQKMQYDWQAQQAKQAGDQQQGAQELGLKREQLAAEMQLKREQLAAEIQLKREQFAAELAMKREMGMAGIVAQANAPTTTTSGVHMGGEPG